MTRYAAWLLLLLASRLLTGCSGLFGHSPGAAQPRYTIGPAYQAGAAWFYPREDFHLDATGLAVVLPDRTGLTADGEMRDQAAMAGAHATLQLPTVARVTNLETGLQALIRINDRGPSSPGRLLGLTRHAADRLDIAAGAVTRIRLQVEDGPSLALRSSSHGDSGITLASAPREPVTSEELAPPPGLERSSRGRVAPIAATTGRRGPPDVDVLASVPDTVVRVPVSASRLWLRAGEFGQARYANQVRMRLAGLAATVERVRQGRFETFRVRVGPFANVDQADKALDQALGAGVTDAQIVVE